MEDLSKVFEPIGELLIADKLLSDNDLMPKATPVVLTAGQSFPIALPDITFNIEAGTSFEVALFNSQDDLDKDGFLAIKNAPITFLPATDAYLKYINDVSAKANTAIDLPSIGFDIKLAAAGNAKSIYYKKHSSFEPINFAFIADIATYKTIFKFEDIEALEEGNALGFLINGSLNGSVKVSWSAILTQSLTSLTDELPFPVTLDLNLTPGVTAEFDISITDNFIYLVKKLPNDQCLVSFRKSKNTTTGISASASVGVKFSKKQVLDQQLNDIYDKVIQSIFGHSATDIDNALKNFKEGTADVTQSGIVTALFAYFQLDNTPGAIDALIEKVTKIETEVPNNIKKLVETTLTFNFSYQYKRIEENQDVISLNIATSDLKGFHSDLLRFNQAGLLDALRANQFPYTLNTYLNETKLTVSNSWGFGFKAFDFSLQGRDNVQSTEVKRVDLAGTHQQISLDRNVSYKWNLGKQSGLWLGEIEASMQEFSEAPTADEFDFNLILDTVLVDTNMDATDFKSYLDFAVLWGAIQQTDLDKLIARYANTAGLLGNQVTVENKIVIPNAALRQLFEAIAATGWNTSNQTMLAMAMAAAMSYIDGFPARTSLQIRQQVYTRLWMNFLANHDPDRAIEDYAADAERLLQAIGGMDNLAGFEANPSNWTFGDSFAGVIRSNPQLFDSLKSFIDGITQLQNSIQNKDDYQKLNDVFKEMDDTFSQLYSLKTIGNFLLSHATELNILKDITQTFTITYGTPGNVQVVNFSVI